MAARAHPSRPASAASRAATGSLCRCASTNSPRRPKSRVSERSAIARNAASAPARSPLSCAACARSSSASGSSPRLRSACPANCSAARASPAPIATSPRETASNPLRRARSRIASEIALGERESSRTSDQRNTAAIATRPMPAIATITDMSARWPSQVTVTVPGRSASHTTPSAINVTAIRNATTRTMLTVRLSRARRPRHRQACGPSRVPLRAPARGR